MKYAFNQSIWVAVMGIILLQGCATTGSSSAMNVAKCFNKGNWTNCIEPIGKLILEVVENTKIADAEKVNQEAKNAGLKIPQNEVKKLSFVVALHPGAVVKAGDKVVLVSTAKLYGKGNSRIEQRTQLFDQGNKPVGQPRTETFDTEGGAAGAYTSKATYTIPNGWSGQKYVFQTVLLVDGKEVDWNSDAKMTVLAASPTNNGFLASLQ